MGAPVMTPSTAPVTVTFTMTRVKGNGGDDTIYGGSGSDTINGNNGGDTIIGGFGADNLTGSNGDDRFVYLSVADSNATQFDVISDFKSGSDRINLTALGALAFQWH